MDPNNNLVPGIDPNELAAAAAAEANSVPEVNPAPEGNPAADIANAAMAGAESVVTTTDPTASDVAPEPTLQTVEAPAPAEDGPVSLAPSADFQMGEVSTVSAVQNGADGNLAAAQDEVMIGQPLEQPSQDLAASSTQPENPMEDQNIDQLANTEMGEKSTGQEVADFNDPEAAAAAEAAAKTTKDEEDDEPIVAAAPVPGSIGSAKSYVDIQRAEAAKAAKVAAKQNKETKLSKNTIIIIAIAAVAVIGIIVGAFLMFGSSNPTPTVTTTATYTDDDSNHDYSTLSCKRQLAHEEYDSYGATSGTYENIFYFKDDVLDGLVTNFSYTYENLQIATLYRDQFMRDFGLTEEGRAGKDNEKTNEETEEPGTEESETETDDTTTKKTPEQMLKHYIALDKFTVIHGMEIKSEDINDWLASDAYSDRTYGATEKATTTTGTGETEAEEPTRNLDYYKSLQNNIDFTCEITKGY